MTDAIARAAPRAPAIPTRPNWPTPSWPRISPCCPDGRALATRIEKTFRFPDFARTIAFVNAVAATRRSARTTIPICGVHYDRCVVAWSTHSAGGVTLNDVICAAKVEVLRA